ncbi:hypothetical protein [uncultured Roseobacter sp.]|uniref:hypothetical protein n=1 Tax=uncultured Roseobacter sp. TaxID=114847 RepID=UPI0026125080|nr:hypothetical protein [uncultured Roseobacter sp.]
MAKGIVDLKRITIGVSTNDHGQLRFEIVGESHVIKVFRQGRIVVGFLQIFLERTCRAKTVRQRLADVGREFSLTTQERPEISERHAQNLSEGCHV